MQVPLQKSGCDQSFTDNPCPQYSDKFLENSAFFKFLNANCNVKQTVQNRLGDGEDGDEESEEVAAVNSYVIGIVNYNEIMKELKSELESLYKIQTKTVPLYNKKVQEMKKAGKRTGSYTKAIPMPLEMKFKTFSNKAAIEAYNKDPLLGTTEDYPGLCFGIIIDGDVEAGYDVELMFNNEEQDRRNQQIPSQNKRAVNPLVNNADQDSFNYYINESFSMVHNWIANFILR